MHAAYLVEAVLPLPRIVTALIHAHTHTHTHTHAHTRHEAHAAATGQLAESQHASTLGCTAKEGGGHAAVLPMQAPCHTHASHSAAQGTASNVSST